VFSAFQPALHFSETFYIENTLKAAAIRLPMQRVRDLDLPLHRLCKIPTKGTKDAKETKQEQQEEREESQCLHAHVPHLPSYERTHQIPRHLSLHRLPKHEAFCGVFGPVYVKLSDNQHHEIVAVVYAAAVLDEQAKREYVCSC
jgi:hypothetical protein